MEVTELLLPRLFSDFIITGSALFPTSAPPSSPFLPLHPSSPPVDFKSFCYFLLIAHAVFPCSFFSCFRIRYASFVITNIKSSCFSCTVLVTGVESEADKHSTRAATTQPSISHSSQFLKEIKHMTLPKCESLPLLPPALFVFFLCCPFPAVFPALVPPSASRNMNSQMSSPFTLT